MTETAFGRSLFALQIDNASLPRLRDFMPDSLPVVENDAAVAEAFRLRLSVLEAGVTDGGPADSPFPRSILPSSHVEAFRVLPSPYWIKVKNREHHAFNRVRNAVSLRCGPPCWVSLIAL